MVNLTNRIVLITSTPLGNRALSLHEGWNKSETFPCKYGTNSPILWRATSFTVGQCNTKRQQYRHETLFMYALQFDHRTSNLLH